MFTNNMDQPPPLEELDDPAILKILGTKPDVPKLVPLAHQLTPPRSTGRGLLGLTNPVRPAGVKDSGPSPSPLRSPGRGRGILGLLSGVNAQKTTPGTPPSRGIFQTASPAAPPMMSRPGMASEVEMSARCGVNTGGLAGITPLNESKTRTNEGLGYYSSDGEGYSSGGGRGRGKGRMSLVTALGKEPVSQGEGSDRSTSSRGSMADPTPGIDKGRGIKDNVSHAKKTDPAYLDMPELSDDVIPPPTFKTKKSPPKSEPPKVRSPQEKPSPNVIGDKTKLSPQASKMDKFSKVNPTVIPSMASISGPPSDAIPIPKFIDTTQTGKLASRIPGTSHREDAGSQLVTRLPKFAQKNVEKPKEVTFSDNDEVLGPR